MSGLKASFFLLRVLYIFSIGFLRYKLACLTADRQETNKPQISNSNLEFGGFDLEFVCFLSLVSYYNIEVSARR